MEHKNSARIGQIVLWLVMGLGLIFFLMIMSGNSAGIDGGLYLTYAVFGLGILLAVLSGVMSLFSGGLDTLPSGGCRPPATKSTYPCWP